METTKQINKIQIQSFINDRNENNRNGYIGASLKDGIGKYKETAITNIEIDEAGDFVYIYTDNYKVKKSEMKLSTLIKINY